jgi:hypothetical protein
VLSPALHGRAHNAPFAKPHSIQGKGAPIWKNFDHVAELKSGQVLAESRGVVHKVYFPHSGIISSLVELTDGSAIETGMIGKDGLFGAAQALDHKLSLNKVMVQVPGIASVIEASLLKELANKSLDLRALLLNYEQFFLAQVQQTTACNALHSVEQRTVDGLSECTILSAERSYR